MNRGVAVACFAAIVPGFGSGLSPLDVCSVLRNLSVYRGSIITIKGEFDGGWLIGDECPRVIQTGNRLFNNWIHVAWPGNPTIRERLSFDSDTQAREKLRLAVRTKASGERLFVEIEGLLVTRDPPDNLVDKQNGALRGFGHLGMAPAMIVVKTIKSLEKKPPLTKKASPE